MKYVLKKIIIGVAIGTILFIIKGGNVFAYTWSQSTMSQIEIYYKFDLCTDYDGQLICNAGFEGTSDLKQLLVDTPLYTTKSNEYLALKEFNVHIKFNNNNVLETSNGIILQPPYTYFIGLNGWSGWNIDSFEHRYNLTTYNTFVDSFAYIRDGQTDYTVQDNNQYGLNIDSYYISSLNKYVYTTYPYTHLGATRRIKDFKYSFQSGYTYSGVNNIFDYKFYDSTSDMPSVATFLNTYKNNTYLGVVFPNTTLKIPAASNLSSGSWNFMNGNYSSSLYPYINYAYNEIQQEIDNNAAYLNKEMIVASSFIGSSDYDNEQQSKFSNAFSNTITSASNRLNSVGFTSFLNALVVEPVALLNQSASTDFYEDGQLTGSLCFPSFQQGGSNHGWIPIPFVDTGNYTKDYFQVPCLTTDVYSNLKSSNSTGIKNGKVIDFGDTPNSSSNTMGGIGFLPIWLLIQHAVLYVWLTITFVNIVKYCIDTKDSEIEVMDL